MCRQIRRMVGRLVRRYDVGMQVCRLQICSQVGGRQVIRQVGRQIDRQSGGHPDIARQEARQSVQKPGRQLGSQADSQEARQTARKPGRQLGSQADSQEARQTARKPGSQPGSQAGSQEARQSARKPGSQPGSQAGGRQILLQGRQLVWYEYCRFCACSYKVLQVETVSNKETVVSLGHYRSSVIALHLRTKIVLGTVGLYVFFNGRTNNVHILSLFGILDFLTQPYVNKLNQ